MSKITEIIAMCEMKPDEAAYCEECFAKIKADEELFSLLQAAESHYMLGWSHSKDAKELTEKSGLHRYTVDLLILLYACIRLRKMYAAHGYSEEIFKATVPLNLAYNITTCRQLHNVIGNPFFFGYKEMMQCTRFALGRLHFETIKAPFDYKDICKKGDNVLSCHIPSSGALLTEDVEKSFELAYNFFKPNGPLVVVCSSWLLYPKFYEEVFPKGSNLSRFYELFDVVEQNERDIGADAWRVFGTTNKNLDELPTNTTLQKNLLAFLKNGNLMGGGYGILVRDYKKQ